ncbi:hypothetical protein [Ruminococcus flavefaciens]|uniref:hypothetical protein n=1 Tax=Ruminococcus flavefaciens TaxID=1265 RepID=UPI0003011635|nr:hypothetical protein [Ruminococcus flavefaciens]
MRISFYQGMWTKIREWQKCYNVSDNKLAADLRVSERTLKEYDKSAHSLTLEKVDNLLVAERISLNEILYAELYAKYCKNGHICWDKVFNNTGEKK